MFDHDEIAGAIAWRHDLHRHPELGFQEHRTSEMVAGLLSGWGWQVHGGIAGTGIVARLGAAQGPAALSLRADMDALPITEATGLAHASTRPGVMHACGHDGHTAMLLLAAQKIAAGPAPEAPVQLIFQPAEENDGGARVMMEEGLFERFPTRSIYGIHNWPGLPPGRFVASDGPVMAAFAVFEVTVSGRGSHGAMPEQGDGVVAAAARIATALQEVPARRLSPLDPGVISVTQIHTGSAWNVCPDTAVIRGTVRWFSDVAGDALEAAVSQIAGGIAAAHGCSVTLDYQRRYPATVNAGDPAARARALAAEMGLDAAPAPASMASEDFAFMLNEVPGAYLWLGAGREGENPGLHSAHFDFNDAVLATGAEFWVRLVARETAQ